MMLFPKLTSATRFVAGLDLLAEFGGGVDGGGLFFFGATLGFEFFVGDIIASGITIIVAVIFLIIILTS